MEKEEQGYINVGFRLYTGRDDDLIAWYESLEKGLRVKAIQARLRGQSVPPVNGYPYHLDWPPTDGQQEIAGETGEAGAPSINAPTAEEIAAEVERRMRALLAEYDLTPLVKAEARKATGEAH
ncbi:MAG: hypothetical protein M5R40_07250 [Anaerolineae bacterium]|nr:hypothetical protein [Anaerolineae bacterium]